MPGVLYAKVNGQWVPAAPEEVDVGTTDPLGSNPDSEIWVDTTLDPPTIKANVGGVWTPIASSDEASVGAIDPMAVNPLIELWYDTNTPPLVAPPTVGSLKVNVGGTWHETSVDEVWVGTDDPYIANPLGLWEVWHNTTDDPGTTFVRVAGAWVQVTQREVFVDDQDPLTRVPPATEAELWYDTTTGELKVQHPAGSWTTITASVHVPDEVTVSQAPPMDPQNELWVDTRTSPGILNYKDPATGVWVPIVSDGNVPAPLDEVWVGEVDPRDASTELWYDTDAVPSNVGLSVGIVESMMIEMSQMRNDLADARTRITMLETYLQSQVSV